MSRPDLDALTSKDSWEGVRAVVAGFSVAGFASTDNLTHLGAEVVALDERRDPELEEKAELLGVLGADVRLGEGVTDLLPADVDLLVVSPGWRPDSSLVLQAHERGIPVWGEVELAWRLRHPDHDVPWLVVTGASGRGTTVRMLDAILRAEGLRSVAAGDVGLSLVEVVMDPEPYDVIAVDVSSQQLHHTYSMQAESAAVLGMGPQTEVDYPRWHPSYEAWLADTAKVYHHVQKACVYNVADERTRRMVEEADVQEGPRHRLHLRDAVGGHGRAGRGDRGRPRLHPAARHQRRRALHGGRPRLHRARVRLRRPGRCDPRQGPRRQPGGGARRAAGLPAASRRLTPTARADHPHRPRCCPSMVRPLVPPRRTPVAHVATRGAGVP
ncbi:hypothetical protein [Nocardioides daphniae]|uniref:hypothetical protein n=1 Tax=Nocardioides daphniae TaxID=402297 RepID=UPI00360799CA